MAPVPPPTRRVACGIRRNCDPAAVERPEEEARLEGGVLEELRLQPLFALELATVLAEDQGPVARAIERLVADGQVEIPASGARFAIAA